MGIQSGFCRSCGGQAKGLKRVSTHEEVVRVLDAFQTLEACCPGSCHGRLYRPAMFFGLLRLLVPLSLALASEWRPDMQLASGAIEGVKVCSKSVYRSYKTLGEDFC